MYYLETSARRETNTYLNDRSSPRHLCTDLDNIEVSFPNFGSQLRADRDRLDVSLVIVAYQLLVESISRL